ncbi:MAG TPA: glycosyltransferase family 9 protein [Acetobacteraceae bacterium]
MSPALTRLTALRRALEDLHAGRYAAAAAASAAPAADPADLEATLIHALAQAAGGDLGTAPALARIARLRPAHNHPVQDLLDLLRRTNHQAEAVPHLRAAIAAQPNDPRLPSLLGELLAEIGPMPAATEAFRHSATLQPSAAALSNLGKSLAAECRFTEAGTAFAQALALAPHDPQFQLNRAVALLKSGRLPEGWEAFECRHRLPRRPTPLPAPRLDSLHQAKNRTVLLRHEEGFGDTLQFIRYAPMLAALGARVLAWVPHALSRLVARVPGVAAVVPPGALPPSHDAWCPMLSLPRLFGTTLDHMPPAAPYLHADPAEAARHAARLPAANLQIGVAWAGAGRPTDPGAAATDRVRSTTPQALAPLGAVPGVQLISLQFGAPAPPGMVDGMAGIQDFADTAALVANLHAVVSVDTAVAHLAAGMGKPVLLLDRYDNCWRWLHGRTGSPWYPTLTIHRQPSPGNWTDTIASAAAALRTMRPSPSPSGRGPG